MPASRAFRVIICCVSQILAVGASVSVFVANGTSFLWTESAITIGSMLLSRGIGCIPYAHVLTGICSYILLNYVYDRFPFSLALNTAMSNALGEIVTYQSLTYFFSNPDTTYVGSYTELSKFFFFVGLVGSICASIPGSCGFHFIAGFPVSNVLTNYFFGHLSGNTNLLYPFVVLRSHLSQRTCKWSTKNTKNTLPLEIGILSSTLFLAAFFSFRVYGVFSFACISFAYGIVFITSMHAERVTTSITEFIVSTIIMLTTVAGRGPFQYVLQEKSFNDVLITAQIAMTTSTLFSAFVSFTAYKFREIQDIVLKANRATTNLIETQTVNLYRVSHDVNNNNTLIQGLTDEICRTPDLVPKTVLKNIKSVQILTMVTTGIIRDMVEARENTDPIVDMREYDLEKELDLYVGFANLLIQSTDKNIQPRFTVGHGKMSVCTDIACVHNIMCNIIINAVKYTADGSIDIHLTRNKSCVFVEVVDTGIGISKKDLDKIFQVSYRCDNGKRFSTGTGIGLASVKKMTERIGASVRVESAGIGLGSTFIVELPIHGTLKDNNTSVTVIDGDLTDYTGLRGVVIDDSKIISASLTRILEEFGIQVQSYTSPSKYKESLDEMKQKSAEPHFIITDVYIGEQNGLDFIDSIRAGDLQRKGIPRDIPFIICSGTYFSLGSEMLYSNVAVLSKPFTKQGLAIALGKIHVKNSQG